MATRSNIKFQSKVNVTQKGNRKGESKANAPAFKFV